MTHDLHEAPQTSQALPSGRPTTAPSPSRSSAPPHQPSPGGADARLLRQLQRSQQLTTSATVIAAVMPTVLSAEGMIGVGRDVLGLNLHFAAFVAGFLELALVTCGLWARHNVLRGRPGGVDVIATWVFSAASGVFFALHEVMTSLPASGLSGRTWQWEADPGSLLAAGVRIAAPLVAAWLWHRLLSGARHDSEGRPSPAESRRSRRLRALARSALRTRYLSTAGAHPWKLRLAHWVMVRRHQAVLRHSRLTTELVHEIDQHLAASGLVDHYPQRTSSTLEELVRVLAPQATLATVPSAPSSQGALLMIAPKPDQAGATRAGPVAQAGPATQAVAGEPLHLVDRPPSTSTGTSLGMAEQAADEEEVLEIIRGLDRVASGGHASRRIIQEKLGCGASRATRLAALARLDDRQRLAGRRTA